MAPEMSCTPRAGAGTAAAVRRRESLVQVQVHHVHAEVAGPYLAHQRVHVGAIHIEQRALGVQNVGDLVNLALEDAERRWIGEHQRGGLFVDLARESFEIDAALGVRLEILDRGSRRWPQWPGWCRAPSRE